MTSGKPHRDTAWTNDVAHHGSVHRKFIGRPKLWIFGKSGHGPVERGVQVEENADSGCPVVSPMAQRREQCVARELGHKIACEAADGSEA